MTTSSSPGLSSILRLRSEEHTSELQSQSNLVCRLLLEKKKHLTRPPCAQCIRRHESLLLSPICHLSYARILIDSGCSRPMKLPLADLLVQQLPSLMLEY